METVYLWASFVKGFVGSVLVKGWKSVGSWLCRSDEERN